jgi:hypothetical protein
MKANGNEYIEKGTAKLAVNERRNFLKIGGAALVAASAFPIATAAHDDDDDQDGPRIVNLTAGSTGLVVGHSLRTTLTNLGPPRVVKKSSVPLALSRVIPALTGRDFVVKPARSWTSHPRSWVVSNNYWWRQRRNDESDNN